ncbi:MAG: desulfoferrodoxin family protein, partial [Candidatus Nanoarchaeia archaeon]
CGGASCCGTEMKLAQMKTEDQGKEKHVPVIEKIEGGYKVKVGDVAHPMEEAHHIELIEILGNGKVIASARLKPGQKPEAEFCLESADGVTARAYCNLHGLWKS